MTDRTSSEAQASSHRRRVQSDLERNDEIAFVGLGGSGNATRPRSTDQETDAVERVGWRGKAVYPARDGAG